MIYLQSTEVGNGRGYDTDVIAAKVDVPNAGEEHSVTED